MTVRIEKSEHIWTIIHSRPEARNGMDPISAQELTDAFLEFDSNPNARVAVFWGEGGAFCAGWDLKFAASLSDPQKFANEIDTLNFPEGSGPTPRGPLGPSRLELSKPVIGAIEGPAVGGRYGTCHVVRCTGDGRDRLSWGLLSSLGYHLDGWRNCSPTTACRTGQSFGDRHDWPQGTS